MKKFILIILSGLSFVSCKKTLDVKPNNAFPSEEAFISPTRIESAVNGVYDAAQSGFYQGGAVRGYPFGAASIEQGDMRGEDMLNEALFYQVTYQSTYNATSPNQEFMFNTLYSLINRANLVMEGIQGAVSNSVIAADKGNQYIGELRFLRALAYHELLIHFARPFADGNGSQTGVVFRDFGVDSDEEMQQAKTLTRSTVADNYTKIIADLDFAETNLPDVVKNVSGATEKSYRTSKAAAIALKMRVKLHMGNWAGVIADGAKLVPAGAGPYISPVGGWRLMANPGDAFNVAAPTDENIFSIRNAPSDNAGVNGGLAALFGSPAQNGRGLVRVSPIIYNIPEWLCDDKRKSMLITYTAAGKTNYLTTKYKDPAGNTDAAPQIRYAEVLLTLAEAEARNAATVSTRALELLNAVRNRSLANATAQQYTAANFAAKNDLIKAILMERRIEFLAEGKRWADIHRLAKDPNFSTGGIPAKIGTGGATTAMYACGAGSSKYTTAIGAIPYTDFRFIWPIPLSEIQQNANYEQNVGY